MASGLLLQACLRGYWVVLATRLAIDLQLSPIQLVLIGTFMEVTILVSEIPTGVVADVVSRRLSVIVAFVLMGSAMCLAGLVQDFELLVLTQVLWGLGYTFISGAETAWVTDEMGGATEVEPLLLRRGKLQFVFAILGMATSAGLAALTTLPTAIVVSGALTTGWGLVLIVVMAEHSFTRQRGDTWAQFLATLRNGARHARQVPSLRLLAVVVFLAALGGEAFDRLDIRRLDEIGLSSSVDDIVIVGVIASLESLLGYFFVRRVESHVGDARIPTAVAVVMLAASLGGTLLAVVAVLPIAAAGLILQGGLRSTLRVLHAAWANANTPAQTRATVHSFVGQVDASGEILGGVALGILATQTTVPIAMMVGVGLYLASGLQALPGAKSRA